ncbi:MAG: glycoside hydrolase family 5 protein [Alphaproteobacteria bacterium]
MSNRFISALLATIAIGGFSFPTDARPKRSQSDFREIAPRGTMVPRNQKPVKRLKLRSLRKARNQAVLAGIKGFNFSYFETPTFAEDGALVREVFDRYKAEGFNAVRLPIDWDKHAGTTAPYTINPTLTWGKINWVISEARKRGFKVIINVHAYEEIMTDPSGQEARFLAIWKQIATAYRNEPSDLIFEVLNEPKGEFNANPGLWNQMQSKAIAEIRKTNPSRLIMTTPVRWGNINQLVNLTLPNDTNLAVAYHFYDPFDFSHRGATWTSPVPPCSTNWAGTVAEKNAINAKLDTAVTWANQRQVPLFQGEFGTYGICGNVGARSRWTSHVRKAAEARGIGWAYWEAHKGFGAYNPTTNQWISELLNALRYW